ncbi:hypothetical protein ACWC19_37095, partial [Streptomyces sp. 900105245]
MGRHSRRGPAPKDDSAAIAARLAEERDARSGDRRDPPGRLGGEGPAATPYPDGAVQGPGRAPRAPGAVVDEVVARGGRQDAADEHRGHQLREADRAAQLV